LFSGLIPRLDYGRSVPDAGVLSGTGAVARHTYSRRTMTNASPPSTLATIALASLLLTQCGGSTTAPTAAPTAPGVSSVALNATNVAAGSSGQGTVSLTGAALAGGASISLTSSNPAVATVQTPVMVQPGSSTVGITVTAVSAGTTTISAAFNGSSSQSPMLTVTSVVVPPPVATASFGVSGPALTETCDLANNGSTLNCTFDGSTSTAPGHIVAWEWTYGAAARFTQTTSGPVLTMPAVDCTIIPPPPMPAGNEWFTLTITLKVRDDRGNVSATAVDDGARLLPHGMCGF
jgi:hypothetical protein